MSDTSWTGDSRWDPTKTVPKKGWAEPVKQPWVCPVCGAAWSPDFQGPCLHPFKETRPFVNVETKWDVTCGACGLPGGHGGLPCPGGTVS